MSNQTPHTYDIAPSDSEGSSSSIDAGPARARLSQDSAQYDHDLLDNEQETEDLLLRRNVTGNKRAGGDGLGVAETDRKGVFGRVRHARAQQRSKRKGRRKHNDESKELVYEMEEGGPKSPSLLSEGSSELDSEKLGMAMNKKTVRNPMRNQKLQD